MSIGVGLQHWWRDNDHDQKWSSDDFALDDSPFDAVCLIESNFGNLEVYALRNGNVDHWYRTSSPFVWVRGESVGGRQLFGQPSLIQSSFGQRGNFELVGPSTAGGLVHFYRDNDAPGFPWSRATPFGNGTFTQTSLIQNDAGHLEVVAVGAGSAVRFESVGPTWHQRETWTL
jgi:hypothetical protein